MTDECATYTFDAWVERRGRRTFQFACGPSLGNLRACYHAPLGNVDAAGRIHLTGTGELILIDALDYTWDDAAMFRRARETEADKAERTRQRKARMELDAERAAAKGLRGMRASR